MFKAVILFSIFSFKTAVSGIEPNSSDGPLILTPHLENGDIDKARTLSKVSPDMGNITSYAGFFTVRKDCGNNLFWWFFPAKEGWEKAPVLIWLQGGPGASSMYGLFEEVGPFNSFRDGLMARNYSWNNFSNLLFLDNPVGAGFSFTEKNCYPKSIPTVCEELYSAIIQFFTMFPEIKNNKLFLVGESFAGHYDPTLAMLIHRKNNRCVSENDKINLKGIVIANPLTKLDCHDYGNFLYHVGIADDELRDQLLQRQQMLKDHVKEKNFTAAWSDWDYILNNLIGNKTDLPSRYSILTEPVDPSNYIEFLNTSAVRKQIHVGNVNYSDTNWNTYGNLTDTIAQPFAAYDMARLLQTSKYVIATYSGQLDVICMYTSTVCLLRGLNWYGRQEYLNASRSIWYLNDQVVGWFKTADNLLVDICVKDAGHSVPFYKPEVTYEMMTSIVSAGKGKNPLWKLKTSS